MRRQKKCRYCRNWFEPTAQNYRRERSCRHSACRRARRSEALRRWRRANPHYEQSRRHKKQRWRQEKAARYMRSYRRTHAGYVRRNRLLQSRRDSKRRFLVNRNDWNTLWREKIERIRDLGLLVKRNDWSEVMGRQIEGICSLLMLVNRNDKDERQGVSQNPGHEVTSP